MLLVLAEIGRLNGGIRSDWELHLSFARRFGCPYNMRAGQSFVKKQWTPSPRSNSDKVLEAVSDNGQLHFCRALSREDYLIWIRKALLTLQHCWFDHDPVSLGVDNEIEPEKACLLLVFGA